MDNEDPIVEKVKEGLAPENVASKQDSVCSTAIEPEKLFKEDGDHASLDVEITSLPKPEITYPDGGMRAWIVVLGGICLTFSSFGFVNAWGVFQAYYQETLLPDTSPSAIAWIGSIQYSLIFVPSLFVGRLLDLGYFRAPLTISSCLMIIAVFLTAECKTYWQLLLCQGFAIGIAGGWMFGPTTAIVAHWFKVRRARAYGFVAVGSSLGGTLIPIATRKLIPQVGYQWAIRIVGFVLIVTISLGNLALKPRLPPQNLKGGLLNLAAFKYIPFTLYVIANIIAFLGLYTALTYLDISAQNIGISSDISFYFISIANASSMIGRISSGFLADRVGPLNVLIVFTLLAGAMTYAWPFAKSVGPLVVIAVIYGTSSGAFVSLIAMPVAAMGEVGDVGRRIGMSITLTAIGAVAGPPISGAIRVSTGSFKLVGVYAGTMVMLSCALLFVVRWISLGQLRGKF